MSSFDSLYPKHVPCMPRLDNVAAFTDSEKFMSQASVRACVLFVRYGHAVSCGQKMNLPELLTIFDLFMGP